MAMDPKELYHKIELLSREQKIMLLNIAVGMGLDTSFSEEEDEEEHVSNLQQNKSENG